MNLKLSDGGESSMKVTLTRDWRDRKWTLTVISPEKWTLKKLTEVKYVARNKLYFLSAQNLSLIFDIKHKYNLHHKVYFVD